MFLAGCSHNKRITLDHTQLLQLNKRYLASSSCPKPVLGKYEIVSSLQRKTPQYTQGLLMKDGFLYESTGEYKRSHFNKIDLKTGDTTVLSTLPAEYFGEGLVFYNDRYFQLTWREKKLLIYNSGEKLEKEIEFSTPTNEGWGLEHDGENFIWTDGGAYLIEGKVENDLLAPTNFISVKAGDRFIDRINELEFAKGYLYANRYMHDYVLQINPKSGCVTRYWDFSNLLTSEEKFQLHHLNALNGIAYEEQSAHFFITGKDWPRIFRVKLK